MFENAPTLSGSRKKFVPGNFLKVLNRISHKLRANNVRGSRKNIAEHYDLNNDFFKLFLNKTMTYSSAYFSANDEPLEHAQEEKYDMLCRKLELQPSDHLLEIGSGWGAFALHAARKYGCRITTTTISEEQYMYARELFQREHLDDRIEIKLADYRTLKGSYDKIVSIEMLEAVGHEYPRNVFCEMPRASEKERRPRVPGHHVRGFAVRLAAKKHRLDSEAHLPRFIAPVNRRSEQGRQQNR